MNILPLSDEMLQRQYHGETQKRWNKITEKMKAIQNSVQETMKSDKIPPNEKLNLLERELNELKLTIESFHGVMKTEEELELYFERLSVLHNRICVIQVKLCTRHHTIRKKNHNLKKIIEIFPERTGLSWLATGN